MIEPQGAMSGADFIEMMKVDTTPKPSVDSWSTAAAGVAMLIASNPEKFDKDILVEAVQKLATQIPLPLLVQGAMHLDMRVNEIRSER